ncbi:MAG: sulfite reductase subunit alpha [Verrucomicrobia bacterium]|nr:sulfite reductase subunit alpha [Verrucomicrobiota bacterium]MDA1066439.1 sulfite reductase subunit alpha [Verrucomicrobiota bacterium]
MDAEVEPQYDKNNPFLAKLTENSPLYREGSSKDTRHFVVDLTGSNLVYSCGDSLGVYPSNQSETVEAVIKALGVNGDELVTLPKKEKTISFREALSRKLSLAAPTRKTLMTFAGKVENEAEASILAELLDDANKESTEEYLANREFLDILEEFPSANFSAQEFVDSLRKLMPRLYSIASSPLLYPNEIHLTVSIIRYETNNRKRVGVCSTYLSDRVELEVSSMPVFVAKSHFGLPDDDSAPMIMVGPGTGIAPFRAFLQERIAKNAPGKNWLFFGDQHRATDYLYEEEFEAMKAAGHLEKLDLAWSRDQEEKIYVQDKMFESGATLWEWIRGGAFFFVCGDAKHMAKDVDAALHTIAQEHGGLSEEEAVVYFKQMKKEKRYLRDVY